MRPAGPLLLLLLAASARADTEPSPTITEPADANTTIILDNLNGTVFIDSDNHTVFVDNNNRTIVLDDLLADINDTLVEGDGEHEPIVRKKRTFGDIVFRGLADVLGYSVARKAPQVVFPPPVAPVPGIDTPLLVLPAVAFPAAAQAGLPAPAPAAPAPCAAGRAAPPPCRPTKPAPPPKPRAAPPCQRPRAAPRPKPKPKPKPAPPPPPPPPPPCAKPRANPTTPSPCAPAKPPPAKDQADPNLETITSNFHLNFNFNRGPATQAPSAASEDDAPEQEEEQVDDQEQFVPIAIEPQVAQLPAEEPRQPRVYVDAFVVRNGVPHRVDAVDATRLDAPLASNDDDFLVYQDEDDDVAQIQDDYDDVLESREHDNMIREFGNVVDRFWEKKKMMRRTQQMKAPSAPITHYHNVHFGDRDLSDEIRLRGETHQSLQRQRPHPNLIPLSMLDDDDDEATTTTEDPRKSLRPRVLPPTEHNPNQIDTITVRVPPIYKEKRPRKLHREHYGPDRDEDDNESLISYGRGDAEDTDGDDSSFIPLTERPVRRRRRRKHSRRTRSADEKDEYKTDDEFYYFGKKIPISNEEKFFMELTIPPPTRDSDVLRHEKPVASGYFLEDHERLRDDPSQRLREDPSQRLKDDPSHRIRDESERIDSSERTDERERTDDKGRSTADSERAGEEGRADESERSDKLSPNARVTESRYQNKFLRKSNTQVDDPRPTVPPKRKKLKTGKA